MAEPEELLPSLSGIDLADNLRKLRHLGSLPVEGLGPPPNPNEGFDPWNDDDGSSGDREPRNPKIPPAAGAMAVELTESQE